jgi:ABC-type antimicrobial peptide transport system permease subunit
VGDRLDLVIDLPTVLSSLLGVTSLTNNVNTSGTGSLVDPTLLNAILAAAGIDLSQVNVDVNGITALQVVLDAAGFGGAINATAIGNAVPGLNLITVDLTPILAAALNSAAAALRITNTYTIVSEIETPNGKYNSIFGNVVLLEAKYIPGLLRATLTSVLTQLTNVLAPISNGNGNGGSALLTAINALQTRVDGLDYGVMQEYALQISVIASHRNAMYLTTDASSISVSIMRFSDDILTTYLGTSYPVNIITPLADALDGLQFISLFLQQIFIVTLVVLGLLGSVVIYALITGDVEERTYELGMLRALGMKHMTLGQLLSMQTFIFALPGIGLGLAIAAVFNLGIVAVIRVFATIDMEWGLPYRGWVAGLVIGIF